MKFYIILLVCYFGQLNFLAAQDKLVPFLCGDKYGLSDLNGHLVVEPIYSKIIFETKFYNLIACRKDSTFNFLNEDGKLIFESNISDYYIGSAFAYSSIKESRFIKVSDTKRKHSFYINPNYKFDEYKPYPFFTSTIKRDRKLGREFLDKGIVRVLTSDENIMFLDTLGQPVINDSFYQGWVIDGQTLVYRKVSGEQLYLYNLRTKHEIDIGDTWPHICKNSHFITLKSKSKYDINKYEYSLISRDGTIIIEKSDLIEDINESLLNVTKKNKSQLYNYRGESIDFDFGLSLVDFINKKVFIGTTQSNKFGLFDIEGATILDSIYNTIYFENGLLYCNTSDKVAIYNKSLKLVKTLLQTNLEADESLINGNMKLIDRSNVDKRLKGVADYYGNVIISPTYNKIIFQPNEQLFFGYKGSLIDAFNMDLSFLFSFDKKDRYLYNLNNFKITVKGVDKYILYNTITDEIRINNFYSSRNIKAGSSIAPHINPIYFLISSSKDPFTNEVVYFVKYKSGQKYLISNEFGINILPKNCEIRENNTKPKYKDDGRLIVHQLNSLTNMEKVGLIDYDGNWIIPPRFDSIQQLPNGIYQCDLLQSNSMSFYNSSGKKMFEQSNKENLLKVSTNDEICLIKYSKGESIRYNLLNVNNANKLSKRIDSIIFLKNDFKNLLALQKGKYGIIDIGGNWGIEPEYSYIKETRLEGYYIGLKKESAYLFTKDNEILLANKVDLWDIRGDISITNINDTYFHCEISFGNGETYRSKNFFFDRDLNIYPSFGAHTFSYRHRKVDLPDEYLLEKEPVTNLTNIKNIKSGKRYYSKLCDN